MVQGGGRGVCRAARRRGHTGIRRQLTETLAELDRHTTEQAGCAILAQSETRRTRTLRRALVRDHMAPIARMARARFPLLPERDAMRLPRPNWAIARLHASAHGMATATAPYRAEFVPAEGRKLVYVIDALVARALVADPALLAGWKSVKRVRRIASRTR